MARGRGSPGGNGSGTVSVTVLSTLPCVLALIAIPLLALAMCVVPMCALSNCAHPAAKHVSAPVNGDTAPPEASAHLCSGAEHAPGAATGDNGGGGDGGGGDGHCDAAPRATHDALLPAPVPQLTPTVGPPPDHARSTDAVRGPPDYTARALGLHQLQVLRT